MSCPMSAFSSKSCSMQHCVAHQDFNMQLTDHIQNALNRPHTAKGGMRGHGLWCSSALLVGSKLKMLLMLGISEGLTACVLQFAAGSFPRMDLSLQVLHGAHCHAQLCHLLPLLSNASRLTDAHLQQRSMSVPDDMQYSYNSCCCFRPQHIQMRAALCRALCQVRMLPTVQVQRQPWSAYTTLSSCNAVAVLLAAAMIIAASGSLLSLAKRANKAGEGLTMQAVAHCWIIHTGSKSMKETKCK